MQLCIYSCMYYIVSKKFFSKYTYIHTYTIEGEKTTTAMATTTIVGRARMPLPPYFRWWSVMLSECIIRIKIFTFSAIELIYNIENKAQMYSHSVHHFTLIWLHMLSQKNVPLGNILYLRAHEWMYISNIMSVIRTYV